VTTRTSRRRFLLGASGAGAVAGAAVAGFGIDRTLDADADADAGAVPPAPLGASPAGLPDRQHAWTAYLDRDGDGNPLPPRFSRLLFFDVSGPPTPRAPRLLEAALRTLERGFPWRHSGLLFTTGWGPAYFSQVLGTASPVPVATALSDVEQPAIDDYHLCLHLASDDEARLAAVEAALVRGAPVPGLAATGPLDLSSVLRWRASRSGFVGAGLPAARQDVGGIPAGGISGSGPVPRASPLFMGFKSGLARNQASEDDVTITDGPFAGGTTMHASYLRLSLDTWYRQLSGPERVARMYAPQVSPAQAGRFTTDAESDPGQLDQAITRYGVIGHAQASATARRGGRPVILRRDFDSTDGGTAGLHFVCLQRTIADFVSTRTAMNAASAQLRNPSITSTVNNGINEFIFVVSRGNYVVPARRQRSFPLLALPGHLLAIRLGVIRTGRDRRTRAGKPPGRRHAVGLLPLPGQVSAVRARWARRGPGLLGAGAAAGLPGQQQRAGHGDQVLRLVGPRRLPLDDAGDRRYRQAARRDRAGPGQPGRQPGPHRADHESDRQGQVERAQLVRRVRARVVIASHDQQRHRDRELSHRDQDQRGGDPARALPRPARAHRAPAHSVPAPPAPARPAPVLQPGRQRGQDSGDKVVVKRRTAQPDLPGEHVLPLLPGPALGAVVQVLTHYVSRDARVFPVLGRRDGDPDAVTVHASLVPLRVTEVPVSSAGTQPAL
jgi:hypothetical protein